MKEIWKDCKHYEGLYQVSNYGRVKSLERDTFMPDGTRNGHQKEHIMPQRDNGHGYQQVYLTKFGKTKPEYVHRLVAMAFIPNPENKPQVDHIDTDRANNVVDNLRWVTNSENTLNEISMAKRRATMQTEEYKNKVHIALSGARNGANTHPEKNTYVQKARPVRCIETGEVYKSAHEAKLMTNINEHQIGNVCRRLPHANTAGGYHWEYI